MKPIVIDMKDLSESAEIYESAPNKVTVMFIYILLVFSVIGVLWMSLFSIDDVVKTEGVIISDGEQNYHMEIYVSETDYGDVHVGQTVKFEINAFPANEYSYFYGQIQEISKEPFYSEYGNGAFYLVTVCFNEEDVKDANGNLLSLADGLSCRADIVTGHMRVFEYVYKKL